MLASLFAAFSSFLVGVLIFALVIVAYLLLWSLVCALVFLLSLALKSSKPIHSLTVLSDIDVNLGGLVIGIALFGYGIALLLAGHWVALALYALFGAGLLASLFGLIPPLFAAVPTYFTQLYDTRARDLDVTRAEVLDAEHHVIEVIEGDGVLDRRLAIYLLLTFGLNLVGLLFGQPAGTPSPTWGEMLVIPTVWTAEIGLVIGIISGLVNLVAHHRFVGKSARQFLVLTMQISLVVSFALLVVLAVVGLTGNA